VAVTWPLFRHPGTTVLDCEPFYGGDAYLVQRDINLTLWVLAWGSHALATDPAHLFAANAFWPAPWSLALSEHMLGNQPLFAPVYWLFDNPVLAHSATLFASFVLSALSMGTWTWVRTRDGAAASVAGIAYAFAPIRLWQLGSLHVISTQYLPLVGLGLDLALSFGRPRLGTLLVFAGLALSTLCSYYVGYAAFVLVGAWLAVAALRGAPIARPVVATVAAAVLLAALSVPYLLLQRQGIIDDQQAAGFQSLAFAPLAVLGPAWVLKQYLLPLREGIPLFVGWTALVLAAIGVATVRGSPRAELVAVAAAGVVLSFGPVFEVAERALPLPYAWLATVVPGFSALRAPQRFGVLPTLAVTAFAGLAIARLRRGRSPIVAGALVVSCAALMLVEATAPIRIAARRQRVGADVPQVYRWLAAHGDGGPLIELPMSADKPYQQSEAMYWSTVHWLPLVNGYASYPPRTFVEAAAHASRLDTPERLAALRAIAPARWFLVHVERIPPEERSAWIAAFEAGGLRRAGTFGPIALWEAPPNDAPPRPPA
jgi:hypothetical protein